MEVVFFSCGEVYSVVWYRGPLPSCPSEFVLCSDSEVGTKGGILGLGLVFPGIFPFVSLTHLFGWEDTGPLWCHSC